MSYITMLGPDQADERLKTAFDEIIAQHGGRLPPVLQTMSLHPEAMMAVKNLNQTLSFGGSTLTRRHEEMIATLVSKINDCDY